MSAAPTRSRPGRLRRVATGVLVLGAAGALAAACGGGGDTPGVASLGTTTTTAAPSAGGAAGPSGGAAGNSGSYSQKLAYSNCMRKNGVPDFPDPNAQGAIGITAAQVRSPQFQTASTKCSKLLPNGGKPTPAEQQKALAQALKFTACMRKHGEPNFPDPVASNGGIALRIGGRGTGIDPRSPQFRAAQKACRSNLPGGGP